MTDLLQFDRTVFAWINTGWSNPVFDVIMPWLTYLGDATAVWLWIVFIGLLMGRQLACLARTDEGKGQPQSMMKAAIFFCLYMAIIYGVNAGVYTGLKHLFHRSRPFVQQTVTLRVSPTTASRLRSDSSFPSGHSGNAFMVAALLAERLRRKRYYWYGLAAVVALSRVYLGVHYPSDVLAGACLGLAITWLMLFFCPLRNRITRENLLLPQN
jgi:undecaprenyl-diphosphatase